MLHRVLIAAAMALALAAATRAAVAQALPSLSGRTVQGAAFDLAAHRGKVVLLFFWSTDCPVCLDKLPELRRNLEGWRGRDFVIVAVSQDRVGADLQDYLRIRDRVAPPDAQMPVVWRRDPAHRDSFGELPPRAPTTVVLDRQGQVVMRHHGRVPAELWNDIAELVLN